MEEDDELMYNEAVSDSIAVDQGVQIDWGAQIKAGGSMMYPLYLLGVIAFVIAIQRLILRVKAVWLRNLCVKVSMNV